MSKRPLGKEYKQLNKKYGKLLKNPKADPQKIKLYHDKLTAIEHTMANRNLRGIELEKKGDIEGAIRLYEQNVADEFDGSHPYNRLAIIYRKKGQIEDEIRVLEKAIHIFQGVGKGRAGRLPKLSKFKERLRKAKALKRSRCP